VQLSEIRIRKPETASGPISATPPNSSETNGNPASATPVSEVRRFLLSRGNSAIADRAFSGLMLVCAGSIFVIVALIFTELAMQSQMSWHKFGISFFFKYNVDPDTHLPLFWDPVNGVFYALPFICRDAGDLAAGAG
jgi:phosphate transport system permease protein